MYIAVALALVVVAIFIFFGFFGVGASAPAESTATTPQSEAQALLNDIAKTGSVSALRAVDTAPGTGPGAKAGDQVTVNYTGVLPDGTVFDSSAGKAPFSFVLGTGYVIKGWDQGLVGMQVGGMRILAIPPELAYGPNAMGKIPANASLIFEVQMVSINGVTMASSTTVAQ